MSAEERIQEFLGMLFPARGAAPQWWEDLLGEVRQDGPEGRYLSKVLQAELENHIPAYRSSKATNQFFFSEGAPIDGRFHGIGIEEKVAHLVQDKVMDGGLCRGVIWTLGNPQNIPVDERGAVGLFVTKPSKPLSAELASAFLGAVLLARSAKVHFVFVDGQTGDHWPKQLDDSLTTVPDWLAVPISDSVEVPPVHTGALAELTDFEAGKATQALPGGGKKLWSEHILAGAKVACATYSNPWRMIDVGLMLRAMGYEAVRVQYSGPRAAVKNRPTEVAARVAAEMRTRFGVILDWGVPLG